MAQKTYTEKNVIVKKGRIHAGISREFVIKSVLDDYKAHGEIPPETGKDGKVRCERGIPIPVEGLCLNPEEYRVDEVKDLSQVILGKWSNRPGIQFITRLSNCKNPRFTDKIWVKYAESNGNLTVIAAYPTDTFEQDDESKGYCPYRPWVENYPLEKLLDKEFLRDYFLKRGKVIILDDATFEKEVKVANLQDEYNFATESKERISKSTTTTSAN